MKQALTDAERHVFSRRRAPESPEGHRRCLLSASRRQLLSLLEVKQCSVFATVTVPSLLIVFFSSVLSWLVPVITCRMPRGMRNREHLLCSHCLSHKVSTALLRGVTAVAAQVAAGAQLWKKVPQSDLKWTFLCRSCVSSAHPALLDIACKCWGLSSSGGLTLVSRKAFTQLPAHSPSAGWGRH